MTASFALLYCTAQHILAQGGVVPGAAVARGLAVTTHEMNPTASFFALHGDRTGRPSLVTSDKAEAKTINLLDQ